MIILKRLPFLQKSNEDEKLQLPNGEKVDIDDINKYRIDGSIVLYAT